MPAGRQAEKLRSRIRKPAAHRWVLLDQPAVSIEVVLPTPTPFIVARSVLSDWILPGLMFAILLIAVGRKVKVYEAFIPAAKDGFKG